jgi:hypothetical protein
VRSAGCPKVGQCPQIIRPAEERGRVATPSTGVEDGRPWTGTRWPFETHCCGGLASSQRAADCSKRLCKHRGRHVPGGLVDAPPRAIGGRAAGACLLVRRVMPPQQTGTRSDWLGGLPQHRRRHSPTQGWAPPRFGLPPEPGWQTTRSEPWPGPRTRERYEGAANFCRSANGQNYGFGMQIASLSGKGR